jgi:hypothetical protein
MARSTTSGFDGEGSLLLTLFGVDPSDFEDQRTLSRPFDPYLAIVSEGTTNELDLLLDDLCADWLSSFTRKPNPEKQQNFIECMRAVLVNLISARLRDPIMTVGISRSKGRLDTEQRYNPDFMTVRYFLQVLDFLALRGLITWVSKGYQNNGLAEVSRYRLSGDATLPPQLLAMKTSAFGIGRRKELVQLKNSKKQLMKYQDTPETTSMREALVRINAVLASAEIKMSGSRHASVGHEDSYLGQGTQLYRVFNNGSFEEGGRFNGGWWQNEIKGHRPRVTINGARTIEADYRGLHPSILFAKRDLPIPDDPYALVPGVSASLALRRHAKTTFNALLNAGSGGTDEPKGFDAEEFGMSADKFRQSVAEAYPMLPGIFKAGLGLRLQREESELAEQVILHFVDKGVPILPIHDSFIVEACYQDELVTTMTDQFYSKYGRPITVTIKDGTHGIGK